MASVSEDPIRSELFSMDRLERHARALAADHSISRSRSAGHPLLQRVRDNARALSGYYRQIASSITDDKSITPAAEWLIDNFHIVEEQIREVYEDLPPGYYRKLPKLADGQALTGYPRIVAIMWDYVAHTDSRLDPEALRRFIRAYQQDQPLDMGELWAIAISLRIILIENLRRIAERLDHGRDARRQADTASDAILGLRGTTDPDLYRPMRRINSAAYYRAFTVQLIQRLREKGDRQGSHWQQLEAEIARRETTMEDLVRQEHQDQTAMNSTARNIITSMRLISTLDWATFFEDVSVVDALLRDSSDFAAMDFATRDLYRHAIEKRAEENRRSEMDITREVLLAPDPGADLLGWQASFRHAHGTAIYLGSLSFFTAAALAVPLLAAHDVGVSNWTLVLFGLLALIPASDFAVALTNRLITECVPPQPLPKMDFSEGIPEPHRTLVVIPVLFAHTDEIEENLQRLEIHYLSNPDGAIQFALLSDWRDAVDEHQPDDEALLQHAEDGIHDLNARHGSAPDGRPRFLLLHRARRWNAAEGVWMGWERKRGKLHELNRLLRGAKDTTFLHNPLRDGDSSVRYVLTLDADTHLPRGAAYRLAGTMAHRLNHPIIDPHSNRVVKGHGILQPRITPTLPAKGRGSFFQRLFSGPAGVDPYAFAVSDVYQDLFGEGSFTGKGLYDVDTVEKTLSSRIPQNTLLSHDLLEGIYARAALVTDIELFEEFPADYQVSVSRQHRWTRGDWQLLPWLIGRYGDADLPWISRWKMIDNLRRSLSPITLFLALLLTWMQPGVPALSWTLFLIAMVGLPSVFPLAGNLWPKRHAPWGPHLLALMDDLKLALGQTAFTFIFLAHQASVMADAIVRTLYRLLVSRRRLLEWISAAQARRLYGHSDLLTQKLWCAPLLAVLVAGGVLSVSPVMPIALPFIVLWAVSPGIARGISREQMETPSRELTTEDRAYLQRIAHRTWTFFETFVTAAHHDLPPDNFQEIPHPVVANRTSPTNIGLYLLSVLCAHRFGWITLEEAVKRLERTLHSVQELEKHDGHLFNWYDTRDRRPLEPRYVSTVDSGNFAGHLWAMSQACRRLATTEEDEGIGRRLTALAQQADKLVDQMPFEFLFDPVRKLFSIGYRVADRQLDNSYYDLLASEARLASLVAIAKGDVPTLHWFHLSRFLTPVSSGLALVSWSGSMFEYLMPTLTLRAPSGSLMEQTCRHMLAHQQAYARERHVPWGISESGYNVRDVELTYQYSNFGVPGLGLKRGLSEDLLIAPYATALAAMIDPAAAVDNFKVLAAQNAEGLYGFYEALDYTPARVPEGQRVAIVKSHMAHHQGMTLVALTNVLHDGLVQNWFHTEPRIQATELLLQERTPRDVPVSRIRSEVVHGESRTLSPLILRRIRTPHDAVPRTHVLSNSRYSVMLTAAGSGYSWCGPLAVTRWQEDPTCDDSGTFIFLRDVQSRHTWSTGFQPAGVEPQEYEVDFSEDRAEFTRRDGSLVTVMEVVVSPEDDAEIRRVTIKNQGHRTREIDVTSYAEVVLAPAIADEAHKTFSNLFVQTEFAAHVNALLCSRRPRSPEEPTLWAAHVVGVEGETIGPVEYESDRARFLGRGRGVRTPMTVLEGLPLSNTAGNVLDPIVSLRRRVRIPAGESVRVTFTTLMASSRDQALILADKYHDRDAFERTLTLAWTHAHVQHHHLGLEEGDAQLFQELASRVFYCHPSMRATRSALSRNTRGAPNLWPFGISGDRPIVLVGVEELDDQTLVREVVRAHDYWRLKNMSVDLVILNEKAHSYAQELQNTLEQIAHAHPNLFILRRSQLSEEDLTLLRTAARVTLYARDGLLGRQLERLEQLKTPHVITPGRRYSESRDWPTRLPIQPDQLEFFNGYGGFAQDGREYVILMGPKQWTPAPWVNVIANASFGFHVSESGSGSTWASNSRENHLTPWNNDPVTDRPGETFYIRDMESGVFWTPTVLPVRQDDWPYIARHGAGYSRFQHTSHGIGLDLLQYVAMEDPVKISRLMITNTSGRTRRLSVTAYVEWALGASRRVNAPYIITERDPVTGAILARNPWNTEFGSHVAFADMSGQQMSWTADRTEVLGRNGTMDRPAAIERGSALSGNVGPGLDPCAALQRVIEIKNGQSIEVVFFLGQAADRVAATELVKRCRGFVLDDILARMQQQWGDILQAVQVRTPSRSMDLMMNRWLLYQTMACRLYARAGFYQAGGAYGFRDQLQDAMALTVSRRDLTRAQILRTAARQFSEGDVQHWWHPPTGRGVRTRMSDDRVWLPYAVLQYLEVTEDFSILEEMIPFLESRPIPDGREDVYYTPAVTTEKASLFEHCARALDCSLPVGAHGLPLIGTGDWNDGMNRVGHEGRGESVWLAWFLHTTLWEFAKLAERRGESSRAETWRLHVGELKSAVEKHGWDGEWYRRAFFDDGTPLGSSANSECRIDSIAQSWGVISGGADPARAARAMAAVDEQLVRDKDGMVLLFTPPFNRSEPNPGYIQGYLPGVRENGGQYTHAAVWTILAFAALGNGKRAGEIFEMINPIHHGHTPDRIHRYKVEPYVIAADIYSEAPHTGRGGWTWYTGSAGWMYRAGMEWILGFRLRGTKLHLDPCIPPEWPSYEITFRYHATRYEVTVENPHHVSRGIQSAEMDGKPVRGGSADILLVDDGATHHIRVVLGPVN